MSGVPTSPDVAWVATLREGDAVAVAERGQWIYDAVVLRVTPGGLLKVGQPGDSLRQATAFYGFSCKHHPRPAYFAGTGLHSNRYLVKPPEGTP